jgi:hypothetical protein
MGINPAVFIANLYLFWYEYTFVLRLNTQLAVLQVRVHGHVSVPPAPRWLTAA